MGMLYRGDKVVTPVIVKEKEVVPSYVPSKIIDSTGKITRDPKQTTFSIVPATDVGEYGLYYAFYNNPYLTSADLSSLTTISGSNGMGYCFQSCTGLTSVDLSSLTTISGGSGMLSCFFGCTSLTSVEFPSLTTISSSQAMGNCFYNCSNLTSVDFSSLTTISSSNAMSACFYSCRKLTELRFPALTTIHNQAFGTASYNYFFAFCTALTEIHFRADMQATIEALTGYADKWGATNATIYFDL